MGTRRPNHAGSIFLTVDGRWAGSVMIGGHRSKVYANDREGVERKIAALRDLAGAGMPRRISTVHPGAISKTEAAIRALRMAREQGMDDNETARLILASIQYGRTRRGIFGPCVYCGDLFANEVEHDIPLARGGTDEPGNVVSSCRRCNKAKGPRTGAEFRAQSA